MRSPAADPSAATTRPRRRLHRRLRRGELCRPGGLSLVCGLDAPGAERSSVGLRPFRRSDSVRPLRPPRTPDGDSSTRMRVTPDFRWRHSNPPTDGTSSAGEDAGGLSSDLAVRLGDGTCLGSLARGTSRGSFARARCRRSHETSSRPRSASHWDREIGAASAATGTSAVVGSARLSGPVEHCYRLGRHRMAGLGGSFRRNRHGGISRALRFPSSRRRRPPIRSLGPKRPLRAASSRSTHR